MKNIESNINQLILWLQERVKEAGAQGVVFGLSGGIDSAVVAGVAKLAFPHNSLGLIMPCHSDPIDEEHGRLVADSLDLKIEKVDLSPVYDSIIHATNIPTTNRLAKANIKPRLRMTTLYFYAQSYNYLVLSGTNKSEFTTGYFTKHGDSGVDLFPIASFVKKEIIAMAKYLKIPKEIIEKTPSAGLWSGQSDEEEMGFSYDILDEYILHGREDREVVEKIKDMNRKSEHKRKFPPIFTPEINNK